MSPPPFQRFLDEHRDDVYRFLLAMVGRHDADDCFQETFLAALRAYPRLRADSNMHAWVLRIAHRKALDARRRREVPTAAIPEKSVHQTDSYEPRLWDAVRALPDKQRTAVAFRFVHDLPFARIAEIMGGTPEAARRNVHDAVRRLRLTWMT